MSLCIVLVKHAQPVLDPSVPPREWRLADEGEAQARRLANFLQRFVPLELVCSPEPKATRTCEIVASELGAPFTVVEGLREFDRPVLPVMTADEHERVNAALFREFDRRVIGEESAAEALERFSKALLGQLERAGDANLVVISHGTVIWLLVGAHNEVNAFELWRRLRCPAAVVLAFPSLDLVEVVEQVA